jgi:photosystem II stability/assembly factor-like uncharacterized protein
MKHRAGRLSVGLGRYVAPITLAAFVAGGCGGTASGVASSPSPAPTQSGPLEIGVAGTSMWALSQNGLFLSTDEGQQWAAISLPSGASAASVAAVATAPSRPIWAAVLESGDLHLYRRTVDGEWADTILVPKWPDIVTQYGSPDTVMIEPGPSQIVAVTATIHVGMTSAFSTLFVSADDGQTFQGQPPQVASDTNTAWWSVTMISPQSGVLVAGPVHQRLFSTSDGGATWSAVPISTVSSSTLFGLGTPSVSGSGVRILLTAKTDAGESVSVLVSDDEGLTFHASSQTPLSLPKYDAPVTASALDSTVWVIPPGGGKLYESSSDGQDWTAVDAPSLPADTLSISLSSSSSATAVVQNNQCTGWKSSCTSFASLLSTTDAGHTWVSVALPTGAS